MGLVKNGLITNEEAFGKDADLERDIKKIGWTKTPFLSTIESRAPKSRSGTAASGHRWNYEEVQKGNMDNAQIEGDKFVEPSYYVGEELLNHYQIVEDAYGASGTEEDSTRIDGKLVLASQFEHSSQVHKSAIEQILLSDQAAVKRVNQGANKIAGRCGGLKSFAHAGNTITLANTPKLSWQNVRDILKVGFKKGVGYTHIMMNDTQKDALDDILFDKARSQLNAKVLNNHVTMIGATAYGNNISIMLNPYLPDDEIIAYNAKSIYKVNWRPMKTIETAKVKDAIKKVILSEFTLRVEHPYAFAWIKGLKA